MPHELIMAGVDLSATCDTLDFHPHGPEDAPPICEPELPNGGRIGVVTLASDGDFISSRLLTQPELAVEWEKHNAAHGKAAR